jgi:hypothetical protein
MVSEQCKIVLLEGRTLVDQLADICWCVVVSRSLAVKARNSVLSSHLTTIESALRTSDTDSTDVLSYLENEVRRKDILTKKLGREIKELYEKQVREKTDTNQRYAQEIRDLEATFKSKEQDLLDLNRLAHQEYNDLLLFQKIRQELNTELAQTKAIILKNEKRHALQMADLEKKFLLARNKLLAESADRIAESRKNYKEEVGRELDLESKFISTENLKMKGELAFHQQLIEKLQGANEELQQVVEELEKAVRNLEQKDVTYAANSLRNGKLLTELRSKQSVLQASLKQIKEERRSRKQPQLPEGERRKTPQLTAAAAVSDATSAEHSALTRELSKLTALSLGRTRESEALRSYISQFRSARNDVETHFLRALEVVKGEIVARRAREYQREVDAYHARLSQLAQESYQPRGAKSSTSSSASWSATVVIESDPRLPPPTPPVTDVRKLTLNDLTLGDRERVLQLLFEQLNAGKPGHHTGPSQPRDADSLSQSRASSALSLYTGHRSHDGSSTSLVVSRPASSTRPRSKIGSRAGKTSGSRPHSSVKKQPQSAGRMRQTDVSSSSQSTFVTQADFRPSELAQLGSLAEAKVLQQQHQRASPKSDHLRQQAGPAHEEKQHQADAFFPPRGDTPTELL